MSHNITFRYIVLLRYTDEEICDKQSRKAIELGGEGKWCADIVHIVPNREAKPFLCLMGCL